jgi:hypothetical protein
LRQLERLKREAIENPGKREEIEKEMNKIKNEMEEQSGVKIDYIKITHFVEPCVHVADSWSRIASAFDHHVDVERLLDDEKTQVLAAKLNKIKYSTCQTQTDVPVRTRVEVFARASQTSEVEKYSKKTGTKILVHETDTQTRSNRNMNENTQTVTVKSDSIGIQTDSGIESAGSDNEDVPEEFTKVKKAVLAKRLKKANDENDYLKNENEHLKKEVKDLNKKNDDLQKHLNDDKNQTDKVKNNVKETKSIPDLSEKCNRLQQENERLIIELEKTSVQINVQKPVHSAKDDSGVTGKLQAENERLILELEKTQKSLNIEKEKSLTVISTKPPVESQKIEDSGVLGEDEYSSDSPTDSPKKSKGQKLV